MSKSNFTLMAELNKRNEQGLCLDTRSLGHNEARTLVNWKHAGAVVSPRPGMYVESSLWNELSQRDRCLLLLRSVSARNPTWVFCHASAALVHGLYISWKHLREVHVWQSKAQKRGCSAGVIRHTGPSPCYPVVIEGIPVTPRLITAADCMRTLPFGESLAVADSALRLEGIDSDAFLTRVEDVVRGRHGAGHARQAASHANPLSESGGESIARSIMIENGFMLPKLQVVIPNRFEPDHPYRVDFCWVLPNGRLVIAEFGGFEKYRNPRMTRGRSLEETLFRQKVRDSRLSIEGAAVIHFDFDDIKNPERLVRLLEAFHVPRQA